MKNTIKELWLLLFTHLPKIDWSPSDDKDDPMKKFHNCSKLRKKNEKMYF